MRLSRLALAAVLAAAVAPAAYADPAAQHPFLLWTQDEAAAVKKRLDTDPEAKKQLDMMTARETGKGRNNPAFLNLFKYSVLGDKAAGETELKQLRGFIGQRPPENKPGDPNSGNAQWRDDRTLDALRYDVLFDLLTDADKKGLDETIRGYVTWLEKHPDGPWAHEGHARTGWLPNMQWPTVIAVHDLAVASGDEKLIKRTFDAKGGWKWYFDNYVAGERWYMEEFGKYYSNIGSMLIWCEGLEHLGLPQYGYGYTSKGGANMRNFLHSLIDAGYPRVNPAPGGTPSFATVNMGDAAPIYIVNGYNMDGTGGTGAWGGGRMNGNIPKLMQPFWWEIGQRRFPADGYDYFLAQMRKTGETIAYPSLYVGLSPIDSTKVKAPPAPSVCTTDRGFALLRADESPAYWESSKPAVSLQFGMYYVHYVHDCFSILQYVSHNRFIYNKMGATTTNYAGGDPWRDHVRGQGSGVVVDGARVQPVDGGDDGTAKERIRHAFTAPFKFAAVRATMEHTPVTKDGSGRSFSIDQERALVLTDDYLFDAFFLADPNQAAHVYDWHVLAPATLAADAAAAPDGGPWTAVDKLGNKIREQDVAKAFLTNTVARDAADKPWLVTLTQSADPSAPAGVMVRMLGETDTALVAGSPPGIDSPEGGFKGAAKSSMGVQLIATRTAPATAFIALHEPFAGKSHITGFQRLVQTPTAIAVRVSVTPEKGESFSDILLINTAGDLKTPVTLTTPAGESFTFASHAFLRVTPAAITVHGDLAAARLKVAGAPAFTLNNGKIPVTTSAGTLTFTAPK